jgi:uncharacterized cupredoxin-like copper-binding protein
MNRLAHPIRSGSGRHEPHDLPGQRDRAGAVEIANVPHAVGGPRWRAGRVAALTLGGALLLAACGGTPRAPAPAAAPAAEPQVVNIRASEFAFSATTVRVQVNQPVRLVMENAGLIEHDLLAVKLPARDVKTSREGHGHGKDVAAHAAAGKQAWVEFTPTRKGTYSLECTISGHKDAGMKGTLLVE